MTELILIVAILGYLGVILESPLKVNKTITAVFTGALCWIMYGFFTYDGTSLVADKLISSFGEIAGVLFFLLGAMTIVELIDLHKGFSVIIHRIRTKSVFKLLWIIGLLAFFLSSILDNLATTIIMVTILNKLLPKGEIRMTLAGIVVIAANAGGAFSPIGDITTTLLWVGGQISAAGVIKTLFFPSLVAALVPIFIAGFRLRGNAALRSQLSMERALKEEKERGSKRILFLGVLSLLMVPVIKTLTGLPPFIGVFLGLAMVSMMSEFIHFKKSTEEKRIYSVSYALSKVDISSIFYFAGILLLVYVLEEIHLLGSLADFLIHNLPSLDFMVIAIGLMSAIIDNGSLIAATQGMFSLSTYPTDSYLWGFLALSAGIGGSLLIIGSASGVAIMEKEKISFMWYLKKISPLAFAGFIASIAAFLLQSKMVEWLSL